MAQQQPLSTDPNAGVVESGEQPLSTDPNAGVVSAASPPPAALPSTGGYLRNVVSSGVKAVTGMASAAAQNLPQVPATVKAFATHPLDRTVDVAQEAVKQGREYVGSRYYSRGDDPATAASRTLNTLYTDPVGSAMDASMLAGGAESGLKAAGATRAASLAGHAAEALNPLSVPLKTAGALARPVYESAFGKAATTKLATRKPNAMTTGFEAGYRTPAQVKVRLREIDAAQDAAVKAATGEPAGPTASPGPSAPIDTTPSVPSGPPSTPSTAASLGPDFTPVGEEASHNAVRPGGTQARPIPPPPSSARAQVLQDAQDPVKLAEARAAQRKAAGIPPPGPASDTPAAGTAATPPPSHTPPDIPPATRRPPAQQEAPYVATQDILQAPEYQALHEKYQHFPEETAAVVKAGEPLITAPRVIPLAQANTMRKVYNERTQAAFEKNAPPQPKARTQADLALRESITEEVYKHIPELKTLNAEDSNLISFYQAINKAVTKAPSGMSRLSGAGVLAAGASGQAKVALALLTQHVLSNPSVRLALGVLLRKVGQASGGTAAQTALAGSRAQAVVDQKPAMTPPPTPR